MSLSEDMQWAIGLLEDAKTREDVALAAGVALAVLHRAVEPVLVVETYEKNTKPAGGTVPPVTTYGFRHVQVAATDTPLDLLDRIIEDALTHTTVGSTAESATKVAQAILAHPNILVNVVPQR